MVNSQLGRPGPRPATGSSPSTARPARSSGGPRRPFPIQRHVLLQPGGRRDQRPAAAHHRRGRRRTSTPSRSGPASRCGATSSATASSTRSPVVDGNLVYMQPRRGEPGRRSPIGRVICLDARRSTRRPSSRSWSGSRSGWRSGSGWRPRPSPTAGCTCPTTRRAALLRRQGRQAALAGTATAPWSAGRPLVADGKLYIFDVNAKLAILKLNGDEDPEELDSIPFRRTPAPGSSRRTARRSPSTASSTSRPRTRLYCIGEPGTGKTGTVQAAARRGRVQEGRHRRRPSASSRPTCRPSRARRSSSRSSSSTPTAARWPRRPTPRSSGRCRNRRCRRPPRRAPTRRRRSTARSRTARSTARQAPPSQQGYVEAKVGGLTARARVRVAAAGPLRQGLREGPRRRRPGGWVNTQGKYSSSRRTATRCCRR